MARACNDASRRNKKNALDNLCSFADFVGAGYGHLLTAAGLIHILLVIALVVMVLRLMQGRRIV